MIEKWYTEDKYLLKYSFDINQSTNSLPTSDEDSEKREKEQAESETQCDIK